MKLQVPWLRRVQRLLAVWETREQIKQMEKIRDRTGPFPILDAFIEWKKRELEQFSRKD